MKKIILMLTLILGLVSLTSCEEKAQITLINDKGEEETVEIVATEDKETVQKVLDYADSAKYDDITKLTISDSMNLNVIISDELATLLELKDTNRLTATYKDSLKINKNEGIECRLTADVKVDENNSANANASVIYNGQLENVATNAALAYVDVNYDYKTTALSSSYSQKIAVNPLDCFDDLEDLLPISPELPPLDPDDEDDDLTLAEFYEDFPNSKIFIESVTNNKITIGVDISYKDIVAELDISASELLLAQNYIDLNNSLHVALGVDVKTGRLTDIQCEFKDASLINFVVLNYISSDSVGIELTPNTQLIKTFELTMTTEIAYDVAEINQLTAAEKAQYKSQTVVE